MEEIPKNKLKPILDFLKIDYSDFVKNSTNELNDGEAPYGLNAKIEALEKQVQMLEQIIRDKDEIIELLKNKRNK